MPTNAPNVERQNKRKPGRPSVERAEALDAAIFEAARTMFLDEGFEQTSMEEVAKRAGVSRTTLYAKYKSKDDLLGAVVDAQVQGWGKQQRVFRDPLPQDFKQRLHHHARAVIQMVISPEIREFQKLVRSMGAANKKYSSVMNEVGYRSAITAIAAEISSGCQDLPIPPRNPERVAEMLMALLQGWLAGRENGQPVIELDALAYADHAVDILFYGRSAW